jgi:hypothetical protein
MKNMEEIQDMENAEEKVEWIVKWYGKYERKIRWRVKRYEKYWRKEGWIVKRYKKKYGGKDIKNMEEKKVE